MAGVTLSDDEIDRYARHLVLKEVGGDGQARWRAATVAVVGSGGIGSPALQYLAGAGVGRVLVIDDDHVEASNLQRQTIFTAADTGIGKATAAAAAMARLNPHVAVEARPARLDASNAASLLADADCVLDGCDNFATRFAVADVALAMQVPLVSAAVGPFEGQLGVFRGWEADRPCYRCFVGEAPERAETSCADTGVLGPVTGVLGTLAALEVLRALAPFGEDPAGRLLLVDLLAWRFRTIRLPKDPGCPACGAMAANR